MKEYLVVFLTQEYISDFMIIQAVSPQDAHNKVADLKLVVGVISVWEKVLDV